MHLRIVKSRILSHLKEARKAFVAHWDAPESIYSSRTPELLPTDVDISDIEGFLEKMGDLAKRINEVFPEIYAFHEPCGQKLMSVLIYGEGSLRWWTSVS